MDEIAEYGIAAHALYKDGRNDELAQLADESRAYQWLRRTVELLAEGDNPEEFLEHTKLELFHDQVFCFTPKGRLIALPRGATPIDFAYAVHTDVGNTAVGAKINGRMAPLLDRAAERRRGRDHPRRGPDAAGGLGIARRHRQGPRRDPPRDARGRAPAICRPRPPDPRARLRAGRQEPSPTTSCKAPCRGSPARSVDDVLAAVGRGEMFSGDVVKAVYPDFKEERARRADAGSRHRQRRRLVRAAPGREPRVQAARRGAATRTRRSRSAASAATCRCASRPMAARCRATASSAS